LKNITHNEWPDAIILCGGKGERLRPVTNEIPKPLVIINDKPILYYVIEHLNRFNINKIHIASGYKSNVIKKYFSDNTFKADIKIYDSGNVDIIKRLQDILEEVQNDVLVLYGDTISNVNIQELIMHHRSSSKQITMTVLPLKSKYGLVEIDENETVESFAEKPTLDKWINIGYFYVNNNYRQMIFNNDSFEKFLLKSAENKFINAYKYYGVHITVNTLSELEDAQNNIKKIIRSEAQ
jgi:glucose-1-phosphate cytidylyltransferase